MAKNLKDIVDEGFTRLSEIGEKRKELLARSESLSKHTEKQTEEFERRLAELERSYVSEIGTQVGQLLEELRQTLAQVTENKDLFQNSIKDGLKLEVAAILKNAEQSQTRLMTGATERLDAAFSRVEKRFASEKMEFNHEAEKVLIELERLCRKNKTALNHLHSETTGKLAQAKNEHKTAFGEALSGIIKSAETSRGKAGKAVEGLFEDQTDEIGKILKKLDSKVSKSANSTIDSLKDVCTKTQMELGSAAETVLNESAEKLNALSKDSLTELEDSCEFSKQELNEKLTELSEFSDKQLNQVQQQMHDKEETHKNTAAALSSELKAISSASMSGGLGAVEQAFTELNTELDELQSELKRKLKELLGTYDDGMAKLSQASEKSFADVFANYKTQLTELIKVQDQLCAQKEDDLQTYLAKLEKQINEASSQLEGSGGKK